MSKLERALARYVTPAFEAWCDAPSLDHSGRTAFDGTIKTNGDFVRSIWSNPWMEAHAAEIFMAGFDAGRRSEDDQPSLIEGVRVEPPDCYLEVLELITNARSNMAPEVDIDDWPVEQLANDMKDYAGVAEGFAVEDIQKCIRIWRERNGRSDRPPMEGDQS